MSDENISQMVSAVAWLGCSAALFLAVLISFSAVALFGFLITKIMDALLAYYKIFDAIYTIAVLKRDGVDVRSYYRERAHVLGIMRAEADRQAEAGKTDDA